MDFIRSLFQKSVRLHSSETPVDSQPLLENDEQAQEEEITTLSEIFGWCLYGWAAEPFIVCAVSTYVPLLLEQYARENGVRLDDHSQPCLIEPPVVPPILPPPASNGSYPVDPQLMFRDLKTETVQRCVVYVLGTYIDTSSYALYTFSFSVLIQTLVVISMSGAADRGHYRKQLLIAFGVIGAISTICYYGITSKRYYIASILAIIANSCFGAVNVCGNSFLPILVSNTKELRDPTHSSLERGNVITKISGMGAASGYVSALIVQILTMMIVIKTGSTTASIQYAIFTVGIWWLVFQIPLGFLLKSRPGPPLNCKPNENMLWQYIKYGWHTLWLSMKHASALTDVLIYLLGWFIVSDSVTTINSAAVLFARSELQMSTPKLVIVGILTVICAIFGSMIVPKIQKLFNVTPKASLICIIVWTTVIPLYGILGFYFNAIGLKHEAEMYILAICYGFSMGGLATVSRSLFSLLIPKGKESTFFSLFSVTDKGSSILGPTVTALITDRTHNIRYCFYFLFFLLIISLPVFAMLDVERGKREAKELQFVEE
uniref:Autophagy-related protein n=1 Tax=Cyberlindnera americana TaxID=36016 RepID=A0A5P8N8K6_9ASCO|nr:MFS transporter [Cyberlindnera americana]